MPKNLKTKLPARRKTARTTMQEIPATSATVARVARETPPVRATNDGTTARGFTIVTSAVKERSATFQSGMRGGILCHVDDHVALVVDVPQHAAAGAFQQA